MNRTDLFSNRPSSTVLVSAALWLVSIVLGGLAVFALRAVLLWGMALVIPVTDVASQLEATKVINLSGMCGSVVFGLVFLGIIIYISERFFRDAGKPGFMRTLITLLIVECAIVLPVWWLFWR
jgi:hypothetical protein